MAYSTILIARYIKTIAFKMTGFPIIITRRVKIVGFKMTGFTAAMIKLKIFLRG